MVARAGGINTVTFPDFLNSYAPLKSIANVRLFARQAKAFSLLVNRDQPSIPADMTIGLAIGQCLATIAYAQLIAENAAHLDIPRQMISAIFHLLVNDLSVFALSLASSARLDAAGRTLIKRIVMVPKSADADWDFVLQRCCGASA